MLKIYKYCISLVSNFVYLYMPEDAQILTLQTQDSDPTLWALVDTDKKITQQKFIIHGTGHPMEEELNEIALKTKYIGTWQKDGYVWHLFKD